MVRFLKQRTARQCWEKRAANYSDPLPSVKQSAWPVAVNYDFCSALRGRSHKASAGQEIYYSFRSLHH